MSLSIDTGVIDSRGQLAWDVLGLGGLGIENVPAVGQPLFDPSAEIGAGSYDYERSNRQLRANPATPNISSTTHALVRPTLNTGDDIRSAAQDRTYVEAFIVENRTNQAIKFGVLLTSIGVVEMGTVDGSIGLGMNQSQGLDAVNSNYGNPLNDGVTIMMAIDFANSLVWTGSEGVFHNGDPDTVTGGDAISAAWTANGAVMEIRFSVNTPISNPGVWLFPATVKHKPSTYALWPAS